MNTVGPYGPSGGERVNPFSEQKELISITSGLAATPTIRDHLLNAITYGKDAMELFRSERLGAEPIKEFFDPLKKQNLQTFSTLRPKKVLKVNQKEIVLKADRELFGRMAVIGQSRDIDLKEVFSFPLGPIPWSLGDEFGMLRKTNKAVIATALEKNIEYVESVPQNSATLLDCMAVVQKLKIDQSNTFGDIAQKFSGSILQTGFTSKRIDVVFDVYIENSIKNAERERRGTSSLHFGTLLENSKVKQWKNFLSSSENKTLLMRYLVAKLKDPVFINRLSNKELYVTEGASCFKITRAGCHEVEELHSIQEEADTRIFLHVKHAEMNGYSNVAIHSPDRRLHYGSCILSRTTWPSLFQDRHWRQLKNNQHRRCFKSSKHSCKQAGGSATENTKDLFLVFIASQDVIL